VFNGAFKIGQNAVFPLLSIAERSAGEFAVTRHGTAFFVSSTGIAITAAHCAILSQPNSRFVYSGSLPHYNEEQFLSISVLAQDIVADLAILKVDMISNNYLKISNIIPSIGELVCPMGYPEFLVQTRHWQPELVRQHIEPTYVVGRSNVAGDVSNIGDGILLQRSSPPSMSGGPLLNLGGEVVGICVMTTSDIDLKFSNSDRQISVNFGVAAKTKRSIELLDALGVNMTLI
jgi:S1-C subfamily serine protease